MRFSVSTSEWQRVLKLVRAVSQASSNVRSTAHSACLFRVFPAKGEVKLEFSLNGAFLDYTFESLKVLSLPESTEEYRKALDLETLQSLKFSGKEVEIEIIDKDRNSTISFSSGSLRGKVYASIPDIENEIETSRPRETTVDLDYQFPIKDFKTALSAHLYGQHHDTNALKRPVRIYMKEGTLHFESRDQVAGAAVVKTLSLPPKAEIDFYINPSHLLAALETLDEQENNLFFFGYTESMWRVYHMRTNIWMPNQLKPAAKVDLSELFQVIDQSPSYKVTVPTTTLKSAISELTPFVSNAHLASKEDLPVVCLVVNQQREVYLRVETLKAKQVTQYLGQASFEFDLPFEKDEEVYVNIKFLEEFNNHLSANRSQEAGDKVWIRWWTHQDPSMPTRGKGVCLGLGSNRYLTSRTNFKRVAREV